MKLLSYSHFEGEPPRIGFLQGEWVVDVLRAAIWLKEDRGRDEFLRLPSSMRAILADWERTFPQLREMAEIFQSVRPAEVRARRQPVATRESEVVFHPPVPDPPTFRDFYAFEQHVRAARKSRGMEMHPTWFKIPVFYYSNPFCLFGHKAPIPMPAHTEELDFELELGAVIATGGRDIPASDASRYIAGFTIINDWSARDIQREEMALNMGPVKGKDFATTVGPYLVTSDELSAVWVNGKMFLPMRAYRNGSQLSSGNASDLYHPWEKMIERASANTPLLPGELFGSGTVGTGCIMELRPEHAGGWLRKGDVIRLEIDRLGHLENTIV